MKIFLSPSPPSIPGGLIAELGKLSWIPGRYVIIHVCPFASGAEDLSQDIHSQATRYKFPLLKRVPRQDCKAWGLERKTKQLDNQIYFPRRRNQT